MSHKFLYAEISKAISEDGITFKMRGLGGTLPKALQSGEVGSIVFVQPKMEMPPNRMMTYKKYMVECAVNLLSDMVASMPPNLLDRDGQPGLTEHLIHEDILLRLREVTAVLAYMINSTSWITGTTLPYDMREIEQRLRF